MTNTPKFDISKLNLQVIDATMNMFPDMFVNATGITFTKKVLEELRYPAHIQYSSDVENKVFAIKACRNIDTGAQPFSKPRGEQNTVFSGWPCTFFRFWRMPKPGAPCWSESSVKSRCRILSNWKLLVPSL